uniref:Outer membrane lipoprotein-sorting protein n=1 Tax=Candidatus Kentrum sp. TC TaxID=2126339 RepID=A0A451AC23_9GAMM|nr:MAG: Outer membrane lipoprotein-sorting protein [Candidatus Kentron sp. TC]VFK45253.1 MAG: Outer membrane lipoprotein-sorting protein [Candidatus Kentron sp. TC]VFK63594.1 MAG: Outer membrane lipoprotein-sorting protein [Candidatus Kentron sp. TC]
MPKSAHRNIHKWFLPTLLLFTLPLSGVSAASPSPEEKGLAIAKEMDRRDTGWQDQQADMTMVLRNRQGKESTRSIRIRTLEVIGDGDKSFTLFDTPKDVKGTTFLSHTHPIKSDDQWLYMPSLKRVKRISSSNKSGPFMGSEFAYEDLSSQEVEKYTYKWLRDEALDGNDTFVVERYPAYKHSGYQRQLVWIDKKIYQPRKIEFFDRKNALLKILTFHGYKKHLGKYWRPIRMEMVNKQTGKTTKLTWKKYRFKKGLEDSDFDVSVLERGW